MRRGRFKSSIDSLTSGRRRRHRRGTFPVACAGESPLPYRKLGSMRNFGPPARKERESRCVCEYPHAVVSPFTPFAGKTAGAGKGWSGKNLACGGGDKLTGNRLGNLEESRRHGVRRRLPGRPEGGAACGSGRACGSVRDASRLKDFSRIQLRGGGACGGGRKRDAGRMKQGRGAGCVSGLLPLSEGGGRWRGRPLSVAGGRGTNLQLFPTGRMRTGRRNTGLCRPAAGAFVSR